MILTKDSNDNWSTVAAGAGTWKGTKAAWEAGVSGGTIPANTVGLITDDAVGADITEITPTFTVNSTGATLDSLYAKAYVDNRTGLVTVALVIGCTTIVQWDGGHISLGHIHGIPCVKANGLLTYIPVPMYMSGDGRSINGFFHGSYDIANIGDLGFKYDVARNPYMAANIPLKFSCYFTYMGDLDHYIA